MRYSDAQIVFARFYFAAFSFYRLPGSYPPILRPPAAKQQSPPPSIIIVICLFCAHLPLMLTQPMTGVAS
jgi:hypothetical protein